MTERNLEDVLLEPIPLEEWVQSDWHSVAFAYPSHTMGIARAAGLAVAEAFINEMRDVCSYYGKLANAETKPSERGRIHGQAGVLWVLANDFEKTIATAKEDEP